MVPVLVNVPPETLIPLPVPAPDQVMVPALVIGPVA